MEPLTLHDYTAAYALDALDREESARYEEHLATCEECQEQLAQLSGAAGALAFAVESPAPPPELRSRILDAGSGPGLVSEAFLAAGHEVQGIDLSGEMVRRARERCARFGERGRFEEGSLFELPLEPRFDAGISRFVAVRTEHGPVAFATGPVLGIRAVAPDPAAGHPVLLGGASSRLVAGVGTIDAEPILLLQSMRVLPDDVWAAAAGVPS